MNQKALRAVQHKVFVLHLSTQNLLKILAQSALSIMGAIENFLLMSVTLENYPVPANSPMDVRIDINYLHSGATELYAM
jgi:hypothetical protein